MDLFLVCYFAANNAGWHTIARYYRVSLTDWYDAAVRTI